MKMDRSWIKLGNRSHPEYIRGVKEFLNFAISNSPNESQLRCPCSSATIVCGDIISRFKITFLLMEC